MITAAALDRKVLPPIQWIVPGLIPEGFGIVAAAPKIGKSWLMFDLAIAVASGGEFLGESVVQRPVLYLALEDGERRLQDRQRRLLDGPAPEDLFLETKTDNAHVLIKQFVADHQQPLIIIDTLARIRPPGNARANAYLEDYSFAGTIKEVSDLGATALGVHHTRKLGAEDFLELSSGTNGITGAADFVMVLQRERNNHSATLSITGRDVPEAAYSLTFDDGVWEPNGGDINTAANKARIRNMGDTKRAVLELAEELGEVRAPDLVDRLKLTPSSARQTLKRLHEDGALAKPGHGVYMPVTLSQSPKSASSEQEKNVTSHLSHPVTNGVAVTNPPQQSDNVTPRDKQTVTNKGPLISTEDESDNVTPLSPPGPAEGVCNQDGCESLATHKDRCITHFVSSVAERIKTIPDATMQAG